MELPFSALALESLLRKAGRIALDGFRRVAPEQKEDGSVVTQADRDVEECLREGLDHLLPGVPVLGEETASEVPPDGWLWVVDPIDGTLGYASGFAYFCVTVGLMRDGIPHLGAVYLPALGPQGDLYLGGESLPPTRNGLPIATVATDAKVAPAFFVPSDIHHRPGFRFPGKVRCLASTASHLALVADGSAIGALITHAWLWDIAGPLALLTAAGGTFCHTDGSAVDLASLRIARPLDQPLLAAPRWALDSLRESLGDTRRLSSLR